MNPELMVEILTAIAKTQDLLESFSPEYVKKVTTTTPTRLLAEMMLKDFVDTEKRDD